MINDFYAAKSSDFVSVKRTDDTFIITWCIDIVCNYDCSYCPDEIHNNDYKNMKSLEDMKSIWTMIYDEIKGRVNNVNIIFTGGELTINPNFLPFVEWLHKNFTIIKYMMLTSNASASIAYYTNLLQYLTHMTFSTHLEWMNEQKFFETTLAVSDIFNKKSDPHRFRVQLMDEKFNKNFTHKVDMYEKFLKENNISYTRKQLQFISEDLLNIFLSKIDHNITPRNTSFNFNINACNNISNQSATMDGDAFIIDQDYNCSIFDINGQEYKVDGTTLYNNNLINWKGWKCSAGVKSIYIDDRMTVFSEKCRNDILGSLTDGINLYTEYTTCKRKVCHPCVLGLSASKYNPNIG